MAKTISGDITAASLLKALQGVTTPITLGLFGQWVTPQASNAPISQYPRLSKDALSYIPEKIEGGQLMATGPSVPTWKPWSAGGDLAGKSPVWSEPPVRRESVWKSSATQCSAWALAPCTP